MIAPLTIGLVQVLYLIAFILPLGARFLAVRPSARMGIGYLISNALALFIGYLLEVLGCFSVQRTFLLWLAICLAANLYAYSRRSPFHCLTRGEKYIYALMTVGMIAITWIRIVDPIYNSSLPGTDNYQFLNFYTWLIAENQAVHDYPSGFSLVTAMVPWHLSAYENVRWAPHLVFLACLPASFGLWRTIGGIRFAVIITLLLGSAWFLYPISAFHTHFIQWTTVFIGLPALLRIYSKLARGEKPQPLILLAIPVNVAFTMTAAYFSLYLNVLFPIILVLTTLRPKEMFKRALPAAVVALVAPLTLVIYYGVLVPNFFDYWASDIRLQTETVTTVVKHSSAAVASTNAVSGGGSVLAPILQIVRYFLTPSYPLTINYRWAIYIPLIILGFWVWRRADTRRLRSIRLLSGVMIVSTFSAMTGIFELPAWQGRNVFIALYTGLAIVLWASIHQFPCLVRRAIKSPTIVVAVFTLVMGPALISPPVIGKNIPISDVIRPRNIPTDNRVMDELIRVRTADPQAKPVLGVVPSCGAATFSPLISNLLRLHYPHPRAHALPGYHMVRTVNPENTFTKDAVLMPRAMLKTHPLPNTFKVHTLGPDYVFAIRKPDAKTP